MTNHIPVLNPQLSRRIQGRYAAPLPACDCSSWASKAPAFARLQAEALESTRVPARHAAGREQSAPMFPMLREPPFFAAGSLAVENRAEAVECA